MKKAQKITNYKIAIHIWINVGRVFILLRKNFNAFQSIPSSQEILIKIFFKIFHFFNKKFQIKFDQFLVSTGDFGLKKMFLKFFMANFDWDDRIFWKIKNIPNTHASCIEKIRNYSKLLATKFTTERIEAVAFETTCMKVKYFRARRFWRERMLHCMSRTRANKWMDL